MSVSRLPCENIICQVCGENWRELSSPEFDGALGVAIVRSVLDGVYTDPHHLSSHLGVDWRFLRPAFMRLSFNGAFLRDKIFSDRRALNKNDLRAWCYYAGMASGFVGNVNWK